jgi:hypothetical protein
MSKPLPKPLPKKPTIVKEVEKIPEIKNTTKKPNKLVFVPTSEKKETKIPSKIVEVELPGISTTIDHIENQPPSLVSKNAIGMTYTHQQQTIFSIEYIDIDRISEKRSASRKTKGAKRPFTVNELRDIARNIKISGANLMNKEKLATAVRAKILQLRSETKSE